MSIEPNDLTMPTVVWINGEQFALSGIDTIFDLLDSRGLLSKRLAVDLNGAIVSKVAWQSTRLSSGDRVEIVHAIGGG